MYPKTDAEVGLNKNLSHEQIVKNTEILSIIGILISLFSLTLSIVLHVHILNPFFAILLILAACGFFIMAKVEKHIQSKMKYKSRWDK